MKIKKGKNRLSIGIAGIGYVGGAVKAWFQQRNHPLFYYDKYKKIGSLEELNRADVIFLCLPAPFSQKTGFDDSALREALSQIQGKKTIVVKSTVLPGSTENYQRNFTQHKILMNPEFLVAKTAIQDFLNPLRQIVGYTRASKDVAESIMKILPKAPFERIVKATEAEMIKYAGNTFLALRVIFANQIYDISKSLSVDYEVVKECVAADRRIGPSHFNVFSDGYRGYGGPCLSKDIKAFIQLAEKKGVEPKLFQTIEEINEFLLKINSQQKDKTIW
jgi:UDPglucose 6-dehydrogenase